MNELASADGAICIYGVRLIDDGARLEVHLAFLRPGIPEQDVTLFEPATKQEIRVRLPKVAVNSKGFTVADREIWEVLP